MLFLAKHLYSCKYGTWFYNCEFERQHSKLRENTLSIFTEVELKKDTEFRNPYYVGARFLSRLTQIPVTDYYKLRVWKEYFYCYQFDFDLICCKSRKPPNNQSAGPAPKLNGPHSQLDGHLVTAIDQVGDEEMVLDAAMTDERLRNDML